MSSELPALMRKIRAQAPEIGATVRVGGGHLLVLVGGRPVARFPQDLRGGKGRGARHRPNNLTALRRAGFDV